MGEERKKRVSHPPSTDGERHQLNCKAIIVDYFLKHDLELFLFHCCRYRSLELTQSFTIPPGESKLFCVMRKMLIMVWISHETTRSVMKNVLPSCEEKSDWKLQRTPGPMCICSMPVAHLSNAISYDRKEGSVSYIRQKESVKKKRTAAKQLVASAERPDKYDFSSVLIDMQTYMTVV